MKAQSERIPVLARIKLFHTAIWLFFAGCIVAIPFAGAWHRFRLAIVLTGIVLVECAIHAMNRGRCPLTDLAGRYTEDRTDNFDIYLPRWLARHNKTIFGTFFAIGELFVLGRWLSKQQSVGEDVPHSNLLIVTLGLMVLITVALIYGSRRWESATREMHAKLESARLSVGRNAYSPDELIGLPAPVQKYFLAALKNGQPIVSAVHIELSGTINLSATGEKWKRFTSTQQVIPQRPGFDWEGRIEMMPSLTARVHDAYIVGEGILYASLFGLVSLANLRGTPDIAQGELIRFLAEAAWYPTALLPSQGVQWKAVDDFSARATLKDGETAVTLLFRFNENGLIKSAHAEARGRTVGGGVIPTPWEGRWSSYARRDGMCIPTEGEVAWLLPEGPKPYFRGHITSLRYEFAQ